MKSKRQNVVSDQGSSSAGHPAAEPPKQSSAEKLIATGGNSLKGSPKSKRGAKKIGPVGNKRANPYGKAASTPDSRKVQSSKLSRNSAY